MTGSRRPGPATARRAALVAAALLALAGAWPSGPARAQAAPPQPIRFAPGASAAEVGGVAKGERDAEYAVSGGAGQTLEVVLETGHRALYFNVLAPGAKEAMFVGSVAGDRARLVLPDDGDYRIRVYLMRSAARRAESGRYAIKVSIVGQPLRPLPAAKDATVDGGRFHASAELRCTPPYATAETACAAGVVRRGRDGTATVAIRGPNDLLRRVLFVGGQPLASDSTQPVSGRREGDETVVVVGDTETYRVPDAFLTGG
jgi:hypothetical protein